MKSSIATLILGVYTAVSSGSPTSRDVVPSPVPDGELVDPFNQHWNYAGCWVDSAHGRILPERRDTDSTTGEPFTNVTVNSCWIECRGLGHEVFGLEFGSECWCGNKLYNGAVLAADGDAECNMACAGNSSQACGAGNRLSVYSYLSPIPVIPVPEPQTEDLDDGWAYQGCFKETFPDRVLPVNYFAGIGNTPSLCLNDCVKGGFTAGGLQSGTECYCGTAEQAELAELADDPAECDTVCPADERYLCGGSARFELYTRVL